MKKSRVYLGTAVLVLAVAGVLAGRTNKRNRLPATLYYSNGNEYMPFHPGRRAYLFTDCSNGQTPAKYCYEGTCYGVYSYEKGVGYMVVCSSGNE